MLSDLLGCDSVYRRGYANPFPHRTSSSHFREAEKLGALIDELHDHYGPFSISYGFICPELSSRIVKYQNPDLPSYHRYDRGAAADLCFHDWKKAPIKLAHDANSMVEPYQWSRWITYSESPFMCIGTQLEQDQDRVLYENRYVGERKPQFVRYPAPGEKRLQMIAKHSLDYDWRGQGYPSYHGGGRKQFHHRRTSEYTVMSDWLYNRYAVENGVTNIPPLSGNAAYSDFCITLERHGKIIDLLTQTLGRLSITEAKRPDHSWPYTEFVPPSWIEEYELWEALCEANEYCQEHYDFGFNWELFEYSYDVIKVRIDG